ncbi:hypothetical protein RR48_15034 [Papilio machaon]|uniref:Uncharacterized protein n=1 Tax=Papilio machaon TaxID=76193 RepID=A0A194R2C0_PAPMA|nr:hypothetical protein RR48_15034 [Papilio machaon]
MGAKESVEAAKFSAQNWNNFEHGVVKHHYRHGTQRSQSLNRGHSLSRTDGTW